jgi:flagellar M-ring protein FliF
MSDTIANDLPARASAAASPFRGGAGDVRAFLAQPAVVKSLPLVGMVAMLGLAAMLWMIFSAAPSRTLFASLPDEEKAAAVEALNGGGIANSLDNSTGAITVSEDDYHRARMLVAQRGLPRAGQGGDEMLGSMPLGASRAVETERIRGAREADLARTIEAIDVVEAARVHLAVQQPSVFVREQPNAAASVMLTLASGRSLGDSQVQAILNLVASSVPGLTPDGVSVIDQNGRLLSRTAGDGASGASERQLAAQNAVEDRYRRAIAAILTPIVGAENFTAEVHADIDFSEVQSTREGFPENQRALRAEEGSLATEGGPGTPGVTAPAGGIPGALSNTPPPAAQIGATPPGAPAAPGTNPLGTAEGAAAVAAAGRRNENYNRSFALGREVSVTRQQTGAVSRVSVAVALRNPEGRPRSRQEIQQIEQLIRGAIGFSQQRGDVVAINARDFAAAPESTASWYEAAWISPLVRNGSAIVIVLLFVFFVGRPLLKKGSAALAKRAENRSVARTSVGGEIAGVLADRARSDLEMKVSLEMIEATRDYEARAALIRTFVRQDPARAALVVRDLIRADAQGA